VQKGDNVKFTDPVKSVAQCVAEMRQKHKGKLDLVIYMSHNGGEHRMCNVHA
jgi:2',3'-cyclic-nucleotide 2'-phosphodiesterase (5'-nucleotidase family)